MYAFIITTHYFINLSQKYSFLQSVNWWQTFVIEIIDICFTMLRKEFHSAKEFCYHSCH